MNFSSPPPHFFNEKGETNMAGKYGTAHILDQTLFTLFSFASSFTSDRSFHVI